MPDPVQAQAFYPDGSPIAEADLGKALSEGKARFKKDSKVYVRNATGQLGTVDAKDVYKELGAGGSIETSRSVSEALKRKQYEKPVEGLKAFGEGVAGGVTAGLSDIVLQDVTEGGTGERAKYRPGARMAGEITGAVGAAVLTGGESAVARAAAMTPAGLIARTGSLVERGVAAGLERMGVAGAAGGARGALAAGARLGAAGAAEGALYGLGQEISRTTLEGEAITAEKMLASMGRGALWGGVAGGTLGAGGSLLSSGARKLTGGRTIGQMTETVADSATAKLLGSTSKLEGKLIRETLGDYTFQSGPKQGQKLFRSLNKIDDYGRDLAYAKQEVREQIQAVQAQINVPAKAILPQVEKALPKKAVEEIQMALTPLRKSVLLDQPVNLAEISPALRKLPGVQQHIDNVAEQFLKTDPGLPKYLELKKQVTALNTAENVVQKSLAKIDKPKDVTDTVLGTGVGLAGILTGHIGLGTLGAGASVVANRLLKEYGQGIVASTTQKIARYSNKIDHVAQQLALAAPKTVVPTVAATKNLFDRFRTVSEQVHTVASNPVQLQQHIERVIGPIASSRPDLAFALAEQIRGDADYLRGKLPEALSRGANDLAPQNVKSHVSRAKMAEFVEAAEALDHPEGVLDKLGSGDLPRNAIEALKARRPESYQELRFAVQRYVAQRQDELPFKRRVYLSVVFDFDGDWSLKPENTIEIQKSFMPAETPQNKPVGIDESIAQQTDLQTAVRAQ